MEFTPEAQNEDGTHEVEVLPAVLDLPATKNQAVRNLFPATNEN